MRTADEPYRIHYHLFGRLQRALCLADDLFANGGYGDFAGLALEQLHAKFLFQLFDRDAECRLADKTGLCRASEVMLACHGDNVAQFRECHVAVTRRAV